MTDSPTLEGSAVGSAATGDLGRIAAAVDEQLAKFIDSQAARLRQIGPELDLLIIAARNAVAGGKRLRPAFCYWGFRAGAGQPDEPILAAAAALELLHVAALTHDDVMDGSDQRRGQPSAHRWFGASSQLAVAGQPADRGSGFGRAAAILLGDLLLVWADELFHGSGFRTTALAAASRYFDAMRTEVTAGQFLDVVAQASGGDDLDLATRILRFKAASYTVQRPLQIGAALAGGDLSRHQALLDGLSAYGLGVGEAFQLRDDLLGVFGDSAVTGKPAGDDLREGKRTLLAGWARAGLDATGRAEFGALFGRADLQTGDLNRLRGLIRASGAVEQVEQLIAQHTTAALDALAGLEIDDAARGALGALAQTATQRSA